MGKDMLFKGGRRAFSFSFSNKLVFRSYTYFAISGKSPDNPIACDMRYFLSKGS
jgi:hypothetical protein